MAKSNDPEGSGSASEMGFEMDVVIDMMEAKASAEAVVSETMKDAHDTTQESTPALRDEGSVPSTETGSSGLRAVQGAGEVSGIGASTWLPWTALIIVGGVAGGLLGASGVLGRTADPGPVVQGLVVQTTPGYDCPGGAVVASLTQNQRVLVQQRSDDGAWASVRDPLLGLRTVWVPIVVVDFDDDDPSIASLEVAGCPDAIVALTAPEPAAPEPAAPGTDVPQPASPPQQQPSQPGPPPPPPPPPGDTTAPSIGAGSVSPSPFYNGQQPIVAVTASDNTAVTGVSLSWSGAQSGSAQMSPSGGQWRYAFSPAPTEFGTITFRMQARDAAGNTSAPVLISADYILFG